MKPLQRYYLKLFIKRILKGSKAPFKLSLYQLVKLFISKRYRVLKVNMGGHVLTVPDSASFLSMYDEIFESQIYNFQSPVESPTIIDCGSNIGLSLIYFKYLYPKAKITGFEADPKIYKILSTNLESFGFSDIEIYNNAVWDSVEEIEFTADGADSGRIGSNEASVKVKAISIKDFVDKRVEMLKIDIEGAEGPVIEDCSENLGNVQNLFIEYHSFKERNQDLGLILEILSECGFHYYIEKIGVYSPNPFLSLNSIDGMDNQLNIFAKSVRK